MVELKTAKDIKLNTTNDLGLVVTPPKTAEYIISRLLPIKEDQKILDPCVGPGIFIKEMIKAGINPNQITAYDINSKYKENIESYGITFKQQDTLLFLDPLFSYNQFDIIVGNPPYLNKSSSYVRKNKLELKKKYGKINAHETYSMFFVNSIRRLKNGGKLGFITSDSFLTLKTHEKLRKYLLTNCIINEIHLAPRNLFQNVSTSAVIIFLTKCTKKENINKRRQNIMRIIPRAKSEEDYYNPETVYDIPQRKYSSLPFYIFYIDVEEQIINLFEEASRLDEHIKGEIGMHTRNNLKYVAAIEGTELAEIFRKRNEKIDDPSKQSKIIKKEEVDSVNWMPYLKRGGLEQYYRPILEAVDWRKESIDHYVKSKNVVFQKEGIVISGVSSRLAARYMPAGCFWDTNKAIGFYVTDNNISIEYGLGLLNSSLYNYLMKGIINNTNSIQLTGLHALPFISPTNELKGKVEKLVKKIIASKKEDLNYDYIIEQKEIDNLIYDFYGQKFDFPDSIKEKIDLNYSIY